MLNDTIRYAGFWIRVAASLIDTLLLVLITAPILTAVYGSAYWTGEQAVSGALDVFLNYIFPAVAVIIFWIYKSATPGKIALKLKIVDAKTGGKPTAGQLIGRYLGYYLSAIPFLLGIIWVAFDKKKQGWHDKLAGTLVIYNSDALSSNTDE